MATVVSAAGPGSGAVWREQGYAVIRRPDVGVGQVATDIVAGILGPGARAVASRVDVAAPGVLGGPWRAAGTGRRPAVAVWHALTAATLENGCPWVVPGSHLGPVGDHARDGAVPVVLAPGDVLVLDTRLRHRPGDNHSCQTRVTVLVDYVAPR
jgi:phytanoyl-CoA hydroxylase